MHIGLLIASVTVVARPEYAVRYGINRCTACHFSPAGGGPRNLAGKYFGAYGYPTPRWLQQEYVGADVKLLYFHPVHSSQAKGGLGLMNGSIWGSAVVQEPGHDAPEIRVLAEQNLGGFGPGPRQWFGRAAFASDTETSWYPQYVLVGRVIPAFGLMTDEHRTYVRLMTDTPWNTGFDTGVMFAANPTDGLHYDLALVNGRKNAGQALNAGMADLWGAIANLRLLPSRLPFMIGASGSWYGPSAQTNAATAMAFYAILSVHRLTRNLVPISLSIEFDQAKNWNDSFTASFVSDPEYASAVSASTSRGYYALLDYDLTRRLSFQYKYDQLALDRDFPADAFHRHGLGAKYYFGENMWMMIRYEKALTGHPSEQGGQKDGALDDVWGLISLSM